MRNMLMIFAGLAVLAGSGFASADEHINPQKCLARLHFHHQKVYPRSVVMETSGNPVSQVTMTVCFASRERRIADMVVHGTVFDKHDQMLRADGQAMGMLPKTVRPGLFRPRMIETSQFTITIPPTPASDISDNAHVAFEWTPCQQASASGACTPGVKETDSFIIRARVFAAPIK